MVRVIIVPQSPPWVTVGRDGEEISKRSDRASDGCPKGRGSSNPLFYYRNWGVISGPRN